MNPNDLENLRPPELEPSTWERMTRAFCRQRDASRGSQRAPSFETRRDQLRRIRAWILSHRDEIRSALDRDFGKPAAEVDATEVFPVTSEIRHALRHLRRWMRPQRVPASLHLLGTRSSIRYEPRGVVLIIAPWNFPFMLTMGPLVSALAAGNRVFLKPSEVSVHTSALLAEMVAEVFEEHEVVLFEGGVEVSQGLLALPFDHIFFTGSTGVGKIVMRAAAEHLTSVTLELGGKSPVIVDDTASLKIAAERIVWGKCINCGQACVAPDYVLVHEGSKEELVEEMKQALERLFPLNGDEADRWSDLARVIDDRHFARLVALLENAVEGGAVVRHGGGIFEKSRTLEPTIVTDVDPDADLMHEEIFGPILPVVGFSDLEDALDRISRSAKPLALYVFSRSQKNIDRVLERTSAGTSAVNDVVAQFVHPELPFGGVNHSGMGKAHGYHGFVELSNERPVLRQNLLYSNFKPIYPPYTRGVRRVIDALIRWL